MTTFLKDLIAQYAFHFIGLQETIIQDYDDKIQKRFDSNKDYLWLNVPAKGKSGGILVGARLEFYDVGSFQLGDFMLQLNLWGKVNKTKWNLLVVYGAAQEENKWIFSLNCQVFAPEIKTPS